MAGDAEPGARLDYCNRGSHPVTTVAPFRAATLKVLQQPKVIERFKELGQDIGQPLTPEQLSQSLREASDKHAANLKAIGFKPD